jgi:hypothetical protein
VRSTRRTNLRLRYKAMGLGDLPHIGRSGRGRRHRTPREKCASSSDLAPGHAAGPITGWCRAGGAVRVWTPALVLVSVVGVAGR